MLKEDASRTYAESRARAKKHAAHINLPPSTAVSSVQSAPSNSSPSQMETQIQQLNAAIRDLRQSMHSPKAPTHTVSATATAQPTGPKSGSSKRPARHSSSGNGKNLRRDPSTAASPQYGSKPQSGSSGKPRLGPCESPFCKDRTRNHATEDCQALQSFLRLQRAGKFGSIESK